MFSSFLRTNTGQSLVEVLVSFSLVTIIIGSVIGGIIQLRNANTYSQGSTEADMLIDRELSRLVVLRDASWSNLIDGGPYYTQTSGNMWVLANGSTTTNNYTISFTIASGKRNNANINSNGVAIDKNTKKVVFTVSWAGNSLARTLYLTRYYDLPEWTQSTEDELKDGDKNPTSKVKVQKTGSSDGYVVLINGPTSGNYVSTAYDCNTNGGTKPEFNQIVWNATVPSGTTVSFQAASAASSTGPFNFIGPNGTGSTYYTTSGESLYVTNINDCYYKYKIYFTSANASQPIVESIGLRNIP